MVNSTLLTEDSKLLGSLERVLQYNAQNRVQNGLDRIVADNTNACNVVC
jgi:hypothetical protein